jgi:hypothetical protein
MSQLTKSNTNYNGDVKDELYRVFSTGFQSRDKGLLRLETTIDSKRALPKITAADNPMGDYTSGSPTESATVTYSERDLEVKKSLVYIEFLPDDFHELWSMYRSVGPYTNLALNPEILTATLDVMANRIGKQMENLVWQGDTTAGGSSPLRFFDGLLKFAQNDSDVIDVANEGVITSTNVADILAKVWKAIPDQFFDDPEFKIIMSTTDYKKLQELNNNAKKSTVGVLDETIKSLFLEKRIIHVTGVPENTIYCTKAVMNSFGNLFLGVWFDIDEELSNVRIMRTSNNAETWFMRINFKTGVNHREGTEIVLYQGS